MLLRPLSQFLRRRHWTALLRSLRPALAAFVPAVVLATIGGASHTVAAAGNCDPNPQFVDCLTPPLGVNGTVQGTTIMLRWSYDPAVFTEGGRPIGMSIYDVGAFGLNLPAPYHEEWNPAQPRTSYPITGLAPGEYAYRVCLNYHTLVVYTSGETFDSYPELCAPLPAGGTVGGGRPSGGTPPPPPAPAPQPPAPELTATPAGGSTVSLTWNDPGYSFQPTKAVLTRDGRAIFPMTEPGSFTTRYADNQLRPNSGPYRYQICMTFPGPAGELCSEEVSASPTPIPPTAPADVRIARLDLPGGTTANGILLRPRRMISVNWRNTAIPGKFITVEREDVRAARNSDPNSPIEFVRRSFWNELTRLSAGSDLTSTTVGAPQGADPSGLILEAGTTYRVCAVVPTLGAAGAVCSQPVRLP